MHFKSQKIVTLLLILVSVLFLLLGYTPQIARETRPDLGERSTLWLHGWFAEDFRVYLSAITLGKNNHLLFRNPYTTERLPPLPYYLYYSSFGFLTKFINIQPHIVYHLTKIIAIFVFILSTLVLAFVVFQNKKTAVITTIISIIITTPPQIFYNQFIAESFPWWQDWLESVQRLHQRPHYVLSEGLLILGIAFFVYGYKKNKTFASWLSSICAGLCVLMVPHSGLPYIFCVFTITSLLSITSFQYIKYYALLILPIGTLLFLRKMALLDPVWLSYKDWEVNFWNQDNYFLYHWYVSHIALVLPSIIFLFLFAKKIIKNDSILLIIAWIIFPIIMYPLSNILEIGKARLLHFSIHIPLSIFVVWGWNQLIHRTSYKKTISLIAVIVFLFININTINQIQRLWNKAMKEMTGYKLIYLPNKYYEGIQAVKKYTFMNAGILSGEVMGNFMPGYAPVISYLGHPTQALRWNEKLQHTRLFYSGQNEQDAYNFLKKSNVHYVVDDPETIELHSNKLNYSFLELVWENDLIRLYKVN